MSPHKSTMKVLGTLADAISTSLYLLDTVYEDAKRDSDNPDACPYCCEDCLAPVFDIDESYLDADND